MTCGVHFSPHRVIFDKVEQTRTTEVAERVIFHFHAACVSPNGGITKLHMLIPILSILFLAFNPATDTHAAK